MEKHRNLSLSTKGLRYKLRVAFYLMSILPLLVCIYLVSNYVFPHLGLKLDITITILISIFIALIGFFVVKEVFDRILSVTSEAKLIALGDFNRTIEIKEEDEVGYLGEALNELTQRIKENMDELKNYSERTTEINIEIQNRVILLSSLLQISSLVSQGAKIEDILKLATEKSRLLANSDVAYLFLRDEGQETFFAKVVDGINSEYLLKASIYPSESIFGNIIATNRPLILDKNNVFPKVLSQSFYEEFNLKNTLALSIYLRGRVVGVLGIGNNQEDFSYRSDDTELLDIFAKQIAIAIENDILMRRIEKLEIKDSLTGLYNGAFIRSRLDEEIRRAINYQRPCAFILLDIDNFRAFYQNFSLLEAEDALKRIATLIKDSVSEIDRVGRTGDNEFAIILPEKNKRKAQEIAEDIRKKIEFSFSEEPNINKRLTVSGGVSENPIDGISAEELIQKAKSLVNFARTQGKNRIIGSHR